MHWRRVWRRQHVRPGPSPPSRLRRAAAPVRRKPGGAKPLERVIWGTMAGQQKTTADRIRGQAVAYTGRLGLVSHEEFIELVERWGGRVAPCGAVSALVVVGEQEPVLSLTSTVKARVNSPKVISERQF